MRTRLKQSLVTLRRALYKLGRLILLLPLALLRFLFRLPGRLWRFLKGAARFLHSLPGRSWRGLKATALFIITLPRRFWRGLKRAARFILDLPRRAIRRARLEIHRMRLRLREGRARFACWWRTRIYCPRTLRPRTQALTLLFFGATVFLVLTSGRQALASLRRDPAITSPTPVVTRVNVLSATLVAPPPTPTPRPPSVTSAPLPAELSGRSGAVAFSMRRNGNTDIYVRKLTDDQLLRLTYHPAEDRDPAWAPDGETLAFASRLGNNWEIYRLDLVSGVLLRLTRHLHYDGHPSWSPDGAYIAFESYRSGNLDLYIMASDGGEVHQLTANQAADFSPAWSPDGRHIAFVSYRDGSKDIFLYPLDAGSESAVVNLTQTPDRDEDAPSWSPDGSRLAFSAGRFGAETIYITTFDWDSKYLDEATIQLFNPGTEPEWSPEGTALIYQYYHGQQAYLVAARVDEWGSGYEVSSTDMQVQAPSWGNPRVDPQTLARERENAPIAAALYIEEILPPSPGGPPYTIAGLKGVNGGDDREFLSDRVDDSFQALRQRVFEATGTDYLANIGDSFRAIEVAPPPGQSPRSWHKAGRAFDLNQGLYEREEQLVELMREDIGFRTYWRVYLRAAQQDGSLGEPLHDAPWDLKARQEGGLAAREGGEQSQEVPLGYYVDFTQLAADYGWERAPANNSWRREWADINWWQLQKPQGLSWLDAMLELYRLDQIEAVFGPISDDNP